jgi:hypothetical protein
MPNYKDPKNKLHWLDDEAHEYLLPAGSVKITDAEAEEIRASEVVPVVEAPQATPVDKLKAFLQANPDVEALIKE